MVIRRPRPWYRYLAREAFYSITNPVKWAYWRIARPHSYGVKVVITRNGKFLLERVGYGSRRWTFPGGKLDRGEDFAQAAARELAEETGIAPAELRQFGEYFSTREGKYDTVRCFAGESPTDEIVIDGQEIIDAGWFGREELPEHRFSRVDEILEMYDASLT